MLKNLVNNKLVAVEPGTKVVDVCRLMAKEGVGCVLVLQDCKPKGLVTDRDIVVHCLAEGHDSRECLVDEVMSTDLQVVEETDGIFDCIRAMKAAKVRRIPVVDAKGDAVGIISFGDIARVLSKEFAELTETTTQDVRIERLAA